MEKMIKKHFEKEKDAFIKEQQANIDKNQKLMFEKIDKVGESFLKALEDRLNEILIDKGIIPKPEQNGPEKGNNKGCSES